MNSDERLQRHVLEELDWEPSVDASKIGVTVTDGIVTLSGHVPLYVERTIAERVAKGVHGVRRLLNQIQVDAGQEQRRSDTALDAAVTHAIEWNAHVPHGRVKGTVADGHVVLEGTVDWQYQKAAAERAVHDLRGVRSIENRITVDIGETSGEVESSIASALKRSAMLNSRNVSVETEQRKVILTGDVHSHSEYDEAERVAWSGRGVNEVENCLTITPWGSGPSEEWGY